MCYLYLINSKKKTKEKELKLTPQNSAASLLNSVIFIRLEVCQFEEINSGSAHLEPLDLWLWFQKWRQHTLPLDHIWAHRISQNTKQFKAVFHSQGLKDLLSSLCRMHLLCPSSLSQCNDLSCDSADFLVNSVLSYTIVHPEAVML